METLTPLNTINQLLNFEPIKGFDYFCIGLASSFSKCSLDEIMKFFSCINGLVELNMMDENEKLEFLLRLIMRDNLYSVIEKFVSQLQLEVNFFLNLRQKFVLYLLQTEKILELCQHIKPLQYFFIGSFYGKYPTANFIKIVKDLNTVLEKLKEENAVNESVVVLSVLKTHIPKTNSVATQIKPHEQITQVKIQDAISKNSNNGEDLKKLDIQEELKELERREKEKSKNERAQLLYQKLTSKPKRPAVNSVKPSNCSEEKLHNLQEQEDYALGLQLEEFDRVGAKTEINNKGPFFSEDFIKKLLNETPKPEDDENIKNLQCPICLANVQADFVKLEICQHIFDKKCFSNHLVSQIKEERLPLCPTCRGQMTYSECYNNIENESIKKAFNKIFLENYSNFEACPGCQALVVIRENQPIYNCLYCNRDYCMKCYCSISPSSYCEHYQEQFNNHFGENFPK